MFKKAALILALATVSTLSYGQGCNCNVEPMADGSFKVKCNGSSTVVLMIQQGLNASIVPNNPPNMTPVPVVTQTPPPTAPAPAPVAKTPIQLLQEQYKDNPFIGIDDNGNQYFK